MSISIPNIFTWFSNRGQECQLPWLILGKGPSFSELHRHDTTGFRVLTLNDAIRAVPHAAIAHFIDFDAFKRCADDLHRAEAVVLPWCPHFNNKPGRTLADLLPGEPVLHDFWQQGRLYWYDLSTASARHGDFPVVSACFFSAEAALDLLAQAGVKRVRSLGIDGGSAYSKEFSDLFGVSLFSNGRRCFDRQFESFARIISRTGIDYAPLDMESPVRIFVAATASEALPVKVLAYSIRRHASCAVKVTPLCDVGISIPKPRAPENQPRTPFSFQRFLIPEVCGYEGHAIYLDSDMLVFKDMVKLWRRPLGDAAILAAYSTSASGRKPQYSVMLMDCGKLGWNIREIVDQLDAGTLTYEQLMYTSSLARAHADIEPEWNSLESYREGRTALLHYTDMNTQPWVSHLNPLGHLWVCTLRNALREGAISRDFVEEEIGHGHIRPSLLYQLDHGVDDAILLPKAILAADAGVTPPYRSLGPHQASPWRNRLQWLRASIRARYRKTLLYRFERRVLNRLTDHRPDR
ncbi:glycosyltransferase family protein [Methyloversatilis thermotolerans]|uniref:hypothetical protein n=1 Tax=Methyloversatilis thermotolerans TaxID=1346290 RepID=UPI00036D5BDE|nr:hypothetical protein [Methyloversatilis thermotolerans]